jgi:Kef-type K+ transport system membrane component KefB
VGDLGTAWVMAVVVFVASVLAVESGIASALIEISLGIVVGNLFHVQPTQWLLYLAGFGGILLTFLAGAEVDLKVMRENLVGAMAIGLLSFALPFAGGWAFCQGLLHWTPAASKIAGIALSTTSLAVVYAVLVETGLTETTIGKIIMASCFVTDFGTAAALSILFAKWDRVFSPMFFLGSAALIVALPFIAPRIFKRYGEKVIEPEIKFLFMLLFLIMFLAELGLSHALLPAFVLGLVLSNFFRKNRHLQRRLRVVSFAMITPFFFVAAGMRVSLPLLWANFGLLVALFVVKQVGKFVGTFPASLVYVRKDATYTTLLMSTGLTMGTLSASFGLQAGILDAAQFSVLVAVVVLSAIIPTFVAQRWFEPKVILQVDDEAPALAVEGSLDE